MPTERFYGGCRGSMMVIVMAASVVCSVIAYGLLYYSVGAAKQSQALKERDQARYAAEAALILVQQRLWEDPGWTVAGFDVQPQLNIPGVSALEVTVPALCGAPPASCPPRQITVTAFN